MHVKSIYGSQLPEKVVYICVTGRRVGMWLLEYSAAVSTCRHVPTVTHSQLCSTNIVVAPVLAGAHNNVKCCVRLETSKCLSLVSDRSYGVQSGCRQSHQHSSAPVHVRVLPYSLPAGKTPHLGQLSRFATYGLAVLTCGIHM